MRRRGPECRGGEDAVDSVEVVLSLVSVVVACGFCVCLLVGGEVLDDVRRGIVVGISHLFCVGVVAVLQSFVVVSVCGCRRSVVCQRFCAAGAVLFPPQRFIFSCENLQLLPLLQPPLLRKNLQVGGLDGESRRL